MTTPSNRLTSARLAIVAGILSCLAAPFAAFAWVVVLPVAVVGILSGMQARSGDERAVRLGTIGMVLSVLAVLICLVWLFLVLGIGSTEVARTFGS